MVLAHSGAWEKEASPVHRVRRRREGKKAEFKKGTWEKEETPLKTISHCLGGGKKKNHSEKVNGEVQFAGPRKGRCLFR